MSTLSKNKSPSQVTSSVSGKIILSGKLNLPVGFGPQAHGRPKSERVRSQLTAIKENTVNDEDDKIEEQSINDEEESNSDDSKSSNNDQECGDDWVEKEKKLKGRKKETPEEKKARKLATKEERKIKRTSKKHLKNIFKQEGSKIIQTVGKEQSINHVSVFKYSS